MRLLITGAKGNFPSALAPQMLDLGHELVLLDIEPMELPGARCVQGDIRDAGAVQWAMTGCDAVIHAFAFHGNMSGSRNEDDFYQANVTGTHNILMAMKRLGITRLVFSSSEVVYGAGMHGRRVMDETTPLIPEGTYPLTKVLGEEMCRFYARTADLRIAMLRYGCFVPADWRVQGMGRLHNWLDRDDVAQSNVCALNALEDGAFGCQPFLIHCEKPFVDADWPQLERDPRPVIERHWPGALSRLDHAGLAVPTIHTRYDISRAKQVLGYRPRHNFGEFLDQLVEDSAVSMAKS